MVASKAQQLATAQKIRDNYAARSNTHSLVGQLMCDIISSTGYVIDAASAGILPGDSSAVTTANNTAIFQSLIASGTKIVFPPGVFWFAHGSIDPNVICQIAGISGLLIEGAGIGVTTLKVANGADSNMFNLTSAASYVTIQNMTIDGNRANQTPNIVHGVRGDAFSGLWLNKLHIKETSHYGIGIEGFVQQFMVFSDLKIENAGGDGFDQKNKSDSNLYQCASNIEIVEFGLAGTTQAGWDCRGAWQISNMVVHFSSSTGSGFRFRNGETGTVAGGGYGGHRGHVSGLEIYGPGTGSSATGIEAVARDCVVQGAYIRDVLYGVSCSFDTPTGFGCSRSKFKAVTVENYGTAGFITSAGANDNDFEDCTALGNAVGTYGFRLRSSGNRLTNPRASGNVTSDYSLDTAATDTEIIAPRSTGTGSPGAAVTGLDVAGARCTVTGGTISGHVTNCSVSAADFKATGTRFRGATTDNVLIAVGGDDASFIGCESSGAASEGYQARAARLQVIGGKCTGNGGLGLQTEASASDTLFADVYMSGNAADFDDQGTNTTVRRDAVVAKSLNEAVAAGGNSANLDVALLSSTTVTFLIEATLEDSASVRRTIRTKVQAYRSGGGGAVVSAGTNEFTTGAATLTINPSASGNNLRVSVNNGGANNARIDTRIWEVFRQKTVEFS